MMDVHSLALGKERNRRPIVLAPEFEQQFLDQTGLKPSRIMPTRQLSAQKPAKRPEVPGKWLPCHETAPGVWEQQHQLFPLGDQAPISGGLSERLAAAALSIQDPDTRGAPSHRVGCPCNSNQLDGDGAGQEVRLGQRSMSTSFKTIALKENDRLIVA